MSGESPRQAGGTSAPPRPVPPASGSAPPGLCSTGLGSGLAQGGQGPLELNTPPGRPSPPKLRVCPCKLGFCWEERWGAWEPGTPSFSSVFIAPSGGLSQPPECLFLLAQEAPPAPGDRGSRSRPGPSPGRRGPKAGILGLGAPDPPVRPPPQPQTFRINQNPHSKCMEGKGALD